MRAVLSSASAFRPAVNETVCGDACVLNERDGRVLAAVIDGLGHGPYARSAADVACAFLDLHAEEPLETLMRGLDRAMTPTRGAAVSVLRLDLRAGRGQFVGVGNVELRAASQAPIAPPTMPGIVGRGLRAVKVWEFPVAVGDVLVLFSDGISSRFELPAALETATTASIARGLIDGHHRGHDDGLVLALRVERAE